MDKTKSPAVYRIIDWLDGPPKPSRFFWLSMVGYWATATTTYLLGITKMQWLIVVFTYAGVAIVLTLAMAYLSRKRKRLALVEAGVPTHRISKPAVR